MTHPSPGPERPDTDPALPPLTGREKILLDAGWRFAFGHPSDTGKDHHHGEDYFTSRSKAGFGDGPARADFDDRPWRLVDLPHDWAVEQAFDAEGSPSHGYHRVGRKFPDTSVAWYRRCFTLPEGDRGRRIRLVFDGAFRQSQVWVNGFWLGGEESGYLGFGFDITEYADFGGTNTIAVRLDARQEEGWFYEGAGIYRHVWLVKTHPVCLVDDGIAVATSVKGNTAQVSVQAELERHGADCRKVRLEFIVMDPSGKEVARHRSGPLAPERFAPLTAGACLKVARPRLWDIGDPALHTLVTRVVDGTSVLDELVTPFGIRTVEFRPDSGFFLNGRQVKLKGTNNHQDHAGVGCAVPDRLNEFRIRRMQEMGSNAWRCSHNPPAPEFLDACDRLGMLVIDENRLMGDNQWHRDQVRRMIRRDRNHPSVILWSLGNEEWAIEGNHKGTRLAAAMEAYARSIDTTRRFTIAVSGGWGHGISTAIDVMGFNYISHGSTDDQHRDFPWQPGVGTEETTWQMTRGTYRDRKDRGWLAPLANGTSGFNAVVGWKHYAEREYLAGLFYWTGFDYRGEPVPFDWPAVSGQFGITDSCGFPKDWFWYLKSWWTTTPVLHVFPHGDVEGATGATPAVTVHSNCARVELFHNGASLGMRDMPVNDQLVWELPSAGGVVEARGTGGTGGSLTFRLEPPAPAAALYLEADRTRLDADGEDVAVCTIGARDGRGLSAGEADSVVFLELEGPGRIIGVGNGDPSSHENDVFTETRLPLQATGWQQKDFDNPSDTWIPAFRNCTFGTPEALVPPLPRGRNYRAELTIPDQAPWTEGTLWLRTWGDDTRVFLDGREIARGLEKQNLGHALALDPALLTPGVHRLTLEVTGLGDKMGRFPDVFDPAVLSVARPAGTWQRRLFRGLAQVIVQAGTEPGRLVLRARSEGLAPAVQELELTSAPLRKKEE